ncbi:MAG: hypothetical protein ACT4NY_19125 [Pseudonocardiales bacterium]
MRSESGTTSELVGVAMPRNAGNSAKAERDKLRERMRGYGCTVAQIAVEMSRRFNLRPRIAWRYALGWTQWKVAQHYLTLHPKAKLGDNRVSEYEAWPHGGSPPSPSYLARLAATYGHDCTAAHLVDADDLATFTPADRALLTTAHRGPAATNGLGIPDTPVPAMLEHHGLRVITLPAAQPGSELVVPAAPTLWTGATGLQLPDDLTILLVTYLESLTESNGAALGAPGGHDRAYHRLVQFLTSWANTMKRRTALRALGWAATAASVGHYLDPDELARLTAVLADPSRVDAQTLDHVEAVLWRCRMQEAALGPHAVLDTVLAQRQLARSLLPDCPAELQPRLLSALSGASRQAGWLLFDLNDFGGAGHYYEGARALAHQAQDIELGAFVLCEMSHLATWQGQPRIGLDHAAAAGQWASQTGDMRLRAYTADVTARAHAADGQRDACLTALDAAHTALTAAPTQITPHPTHLYRYDEAIHTGIRGLCHLKLRDIQSATDYTQQSLTTLDRSHLRNIAFIQAHLGIAYAQSEEVDEAARLFGDIGEIAARNGWARLIALLKQGRADLQPWHDSAAVRALDDRLASYGMT